MMNVIKPNAIKEKPIYGDNMKDFEMNIKRFLRALDEYGVVKTKIFKLNDLLLLQNIPKVNNKSSN